MVKTCNIEQMKHNIMATCMYLTWAVANKHKGSNRMIRADVWRAEGIKGRKVKLTARATFMSVLTGY